METPKLQISRVGEPAEAEGEGLFGESQSAIFLISEKVIYEIDTTGMEKEMCWREN